MSIARVAADNPKPWTRNWSTSRPAVQAYLRYATAQRKKGKQQTAESALAWDRAHGKQLFPWDDAEAAAEHRLYLARQFLGLFGSIVNGVRIRSFIAVPSTVLVDDEGKHHAADPDQPKEYWLAGDVHKSPDHRLLTIQWLASRMTTIGKELRVWNLTAAEWRKIAKQLEEVVLGDS